MKNSFPMLVLVFMAFACSTPVKKNVNSELINQINNDSNFVFVKTKALEIMKTGFNAGDGYREVWIRDYNTFIELAAQVFAKEELKENLLVFCRMQGEDGNIIDGFTPIEKVGPVTYDFSYSKVGGWKANGQSLPPRGDCRRCSGACRFQNKQNDPSSPTPPSGGESNLGKGCGGDSGSPPSVDWADGV